VRTRDAAHYAHFVARLDGRDPRFRFGPDVDTVRHAGPAPLLKGYDDFAIIATVPLDLGYEIVGNACARIDPLGN